MNPIALGPFEDGLAPGVFEGWADTSLKKSVENLELRCPRSLRAAAAATGVLGRKVKRGGAGFVSDRRIGARIQKTFNGRGTSGADRAMERRCPVLVLGIDRGSRFEQNANHRNLSSGVPGWAVQVAI